MSRLFTIVLSIALIVAACGQAASSDGATAVADGTALDGEYTVRCGCAIDEVGKCGNFVEVAGNNMMLTGDIGLGPMEFCKQPDQMAHVHGTVTDGKVVATEFALAGS